MAYYFNRWTFTWIWIDDDDDDDGGGDDDDGGGDDGGGDGGGSDVYTRDDVDRLSNELSQASGYFKYPPIAMSAATDNPINTKMATFEIECSSTNAVSTGAFNKAWVLFNPNNDLFWNTPESLYSTITGLYIGSKITLFGADNLNIPGEWVEFRSTRKFTLKRMTMSASRLTGVYENASDSTKAGFIKARPKDFTVLGKNVIYGDDRDVWEIIKAFKGLDAVMHPFLTGYATSHDLTFFENHKSYMSYRIVIEKTNQQSAVFIGDNYSFAAIGELSFYGYANEAVNLHFRSNIVDKTDEYFERMKAPVFLVERMGGALRLTDASIRRMELQKQEDSAFTVTYFQEKYSSNSNVIVKPKLFIDDVQVDQLEERSYGGLYFEAADITLTFKPLSYTGGMVIRVVVNETRSETTGGGTNNNPPTVIQYDTVYHVKSWIFVDVPGFV
jgi:hypothetical protein